MEMKWLNSLLAGLNHAQRLIIALFALVLLLSPYLLKEIREIYSVESRETLKIEYLHDINASLKVLTDKDKDNLTEQTAINLSSAILRSAQCIIHAEVCSIVANNHLYEIQKQEEVRISLRAVIEGCYLQDYSAASQLYVNKYHLSDSWKKFDPNIVGEGICKIIFNPYYASNEAKISAVSAYLDRTFDKFLSVVKMDIRSQE